MLDDDLVSVGIHGTEIVEKPPPLPDQHQEAAPAVVILLVRLKVLGQVRDTLGQQRVLNLGLARVAVMPPVLVNQFLLLLCHQRHRFS